MPTHFSSRQTLRYSISKNNFLSRTNSFLSSWYFAWLRFDFIRTFNTLRSYEIHMKLHAATRLVSKKWRAATDKKERILRNFAVGYCEIGYCCWGLLFVRLLIFLLTLYLIDDGLLLLLFHWSIMSNTQLLSLVTLLATIYKKKHQQRSNKYANRSFKILHLREISRTDLTKWITDVVYSCI